MNNGQAICVDKSIAMKPLLPQNNFFKNDKLFAMADVLA